MKTVFAYFITMIICSASIAQNQTIKFSSINTGGFSFGQSGTYGIFQSVNGFKINKYFGGVGTGLDFHFYRTIPVFADLRRYLGKQKNIFIYGNAGFNFPWKVTPHEIFYTSYRFNGGMYSEVGAGLNLLKRLVLTAGYGNKKLKNEAKQIICPFIGPCTENTDTYRYSFSRISLKAGIQL